MWVRSNRLTTLHSSIHRLWFIFIFDYSLTCNSYIREPSRCSSLCIIAYSSCRFDWSLLPFYSNYLCLAIGLVPGVFTSCGDCFGFYCGFIFWCKEVYEPCLESGFIAACFLLLLVINYWKFFTKVRCCACYFLTNMGTWDGLCCWSEKLMRVFFDSAADKWCDATCGAC